MIARIAIAVAVLLAAAPADAHDKRQAASQFQKGRALFAAGDWAGALDAFEAGYDAYPLPGFLVNIGQCQRKLDHPDEAAVSFQKFLDSDGADPRLRAEVQEALAEINADKARREAAIAAEAEARRQRDEAERRHPVDERPSPSRAGGALSLTPAPSSPSPSPSPSLAPSALALSSPAPHAAVARPQKSHRWVWAVVGVLAAGAVASAVTVGVLESQPASTKPGSLGLLDGRR